MHKNADHASVTPVAACILYTGAKIISCSNLVRIGAEYEVDFADVAV